MIAVALVGTATLGYALSCHLPPVGLFMPGRVLEQAVSGKALNTEVWATWALNPPRRGHYMDFLKSITGAR